MSVHLLLDGSDAMGVDALRYDDGDQRWYVFGEETGDKQLVLACFLMATDMAQIIGEA